MQPDRRFARRVAARTGLGVKFVAKDITLSTLLKGLDGLLDDTFVLKGGTAIARAGYLDSPRFSEDVDLDVHTDLGLRELGREAVQLLEGLESFEISPPRYRGRGLRIDAHFENPFGDRDRIRVEMSLRLAEWLGEVDAKGTLLQSPFTGGDACLLRTYSKNALFARKVHALSGRLDGKDPFDLRGMWRGGIDPEDAVAALKRYTLTEGLSIRNMMTSAEENLLRMAGDLRVVANSTNHFIPRSGRPDWGMVLEDVGSMLSRISEDLST
jgi:predicted nucleotidyltransferase component of viral defense system